MSTRKINDTKGIPEFLKQDIQNNQNQIDLKGIGGTYREEPIPSFNASKAEEVLNKGNAWIVLGKDRPKSRLSGYGGIGGTRCASIDLVVGRRGNSVNKDGNKIYVDNNFRTDSARILISQQTDVDENFELVAGSIGRDRARSAVVLRADGVRIIGNEGVKIITKNFPRRSDGNIVPYTQGIDLIAGNDDSDLQPMVKGKNLVELLSAVLQNLNDLNGAVNTFLLNQSIFNKVVGSHTHLTTGPSPSALVGSALRSIQEVSELISLINNKINLVGNEVEFLNPLGKRYILSKFNNVN